MIKNKKSDYIGNISQFINLENKSIFFYWKGRVGLYAVLKAIGVGKDDEVVMPGLTCVVVPNAVLYLGGKPVYVDVDINSCNATFDSIKSAVTNKTKAIIVQNTFGLTTDVDQISKWAKSRGIFTIEDCTHGFGGMYQGKPNGSYCDAAIYSTQWNKPYSTGIGGFSIVSNELMVNPIIQINKSLITPSFLESLQLYLLNLFYKFFLNNSTYWFLLSLYRKLSKLNLVIGSSSGKEISGVCIPKGYFKAATWVQFLFGNKSIKKLNESLNVRKTNAKIYTKFLSKNKKYHVVESLHENHSFLKYPILVKNRSSFMLKAEKAHIKIGDWFVSVLHPVEPPFNSWFLDIQKLPNASFLANHLVNLPTDLKNIDKVISFLESNIEDLLGDESNN